MENITQNTLQEPMQATNPMGTTAPTADSNILLQCEHLSKTFDKANYVLSDINITLPRGNIIGLLGPNGSGKTTFIKMVASLLTPSSGKILIDGFEPGVETKKRVSFLPDSNFLPEWMKISDLFKYYSDFFADFDQNKATEMMKHLGLDINMRMKVMSKGTKEKVQLILTMSRDAQLYLLDEPIGGVDPATRDYILQTIINNYSPNSSILISTHLIYDIESVLDGVIFLNRGRVDLAAPVDSLRAEYGKSIDELFRDIFRC